MHLNLEGIVILIDKFGTNINMDKSIKESSLEEYNSKLNEYLIKLENVQGLEKCPGHIQYKVINLVEKRKRGWIQSEVDKVGKAKGIKEVSEEIQKEQTGGHSKGKLDADEINSKISGDLQNWKEFYKKGGSGKEYDWTIIMDLSKKFRVSFPEMLSSFGEIAIDEIGNKNDVSFAYTYIYELFRYFAKKLKQDDVDELNKVVLNYMENLSDMVLDNKFLTEVWGGILYLLRYYHLFTIRDLDQLSNIGEDQVKPIFETVYYAASYEEDTEEEPYYKSELRETTLYKTFKGCYDSIFG